MRYKALGPLEFERDGVPVPIRGPQLRRLFAVLVTHRGRQVSGDRLVEAMWADGSAPDGAARSVMTYVSRLRSALGDGAIVTEGTGYLLDARRITCDVDEFEAKIAEANRALPDRAVDAYDGALALWRGEPYDEFSTEWWALAESTRLSEVRTSAREQRAAALIAIGHHQRAIPDLESLVVEQPLRERPVVLLIQALHATGRQSEALRRARAFRRRLADESGLDPSPALGALEHAVAAGADDVVDPAVGRPLRGYVIHEAIGEGSVGRVYAATQPGTLRRVAVKVIRPDLADSSDFIRRFEAEAQLVAHLEHPHIVPLYDYWREPGGAYLVFRLLGGGTALDAVVTGGAWSLGRVSRLVEEIGGALMAAHAAGVTHHDVKASNVLLDDDGGAYLTDFGIATADDDSRGVGDDVCDLGWLLWELLTGTGSPLPTIDRAGPPGLVGRVADAPAGLGAVIARATAKEGGYASVAELVLAWRLAVGRPDGAVSPVGSDDRRVVDSARRRAAVQLARSTVAGINPYKGLLPFDEADAEGFHGRAEVVEQTLVLVEQRRLVAIVGASGSGKSSLVRAGVVPRLRSGGSTVVVLVPGDDPSAALRAALNEIADESSVVDDSVEMLRRITSRVGRVIVVVDQFEECWTRDAAERGHEFLATLAWVVADETLDIRVVVTIRADLLDRPLQDHDIGPWVGEGTFAISAMSVAQLDEAIVSPANRAGVSYDEGVVAQLIADSLAQPGSLPLLQFALAELFERRVDGRIGPDALEAVGGVAGALGRRAERVFASLEPAGRAGARELFGRLVVPGDGAPDTRRRSRIGELSSAARAAAVPYVDARLLVSDRDPASREPTVEVAHEALLTRWTRLAGWIDDDRRWLTQLQHLAAAARAWDEGGRSAGELYRGARLDAAVAALDGDGRAVADVERAFVEAGRQARDEEARAIQRSARRLRGLLAGVAIALVAALVAGAVAVVQRRQADSSAAEALSAADAAEASARAAEIEALVGRVESLRATQRDTAALLAVESYRLADTPRTRSALFGTFTNDQALLDTHRLDQDFGATGLVLPDGETAFVVLEDGRIRSYELDTGVLGEPWPMPGHRIDPYSILAASADSHLVAQLAWTDDAGTAFTLGVFDVASGELVLESGPVDGTVSSAAFSTDGTALAVTLDDESRVVLFDVATGDVLAEAPGVARPDDRHSHSWAAITLLADGDFIVGGDAGTVRVLDGATLAERRRFQLPRYVTTLLQPATDGSVVGAGTDGVVRFDSTSGDVVWRDVDFAETCLVPRVVEAVGAVFCADFYGRLVERDFATGLVIRTLDAQNGNAGSLWSAHAGSELVSFGNNEPVVSRWRLDGTGPITRSFAAGYNVAFVSPDGTRMIAERSPTPGADPPEFVDDNVVVDLASGGLEPLPGLIAPTWVDDDTIVAGSITAAGLQVVHYERATGELIADGVVFDTVPRIAFSGPSHAEVLLMFPDDSGSVTLWPLGAADGQRHEPTIRVDGYVWAAISPTGDRIVVATTEGVVVFDGDSGAELGRISNPDFRGAYITAADQLFVTSLGGELTLYDLATLEPMRTYGGSRGFIQELNGSADGSVIAVRGGDRLVTLYDVATGVRIGQPIVIPDSEMNRISLAPDGSMLGIGGGPDAGVKVWDLDPERWMVAACQLAGRNLTREEWATNIGDLADYRATCPQFPLAP